MEATNGGFARPRSGPELRWVNSERTQTLGGAIATQMGQLEDLKTYVTAAATGMLSSGGFVWLITDTLSHLGVIVTQGAGTLLVNERDRPSFQTAAPSSVASTSWQRLGPRTPRQRQSQSAATVATRPQPPPPYWAPRPHVLTPPDRPAPRRPHPLDEQASHEEGTLKCGRAVIRRPRWHGNAACWMNRHRLTSLVRRCTLSSA